MKIIKKEKGLALFLIISGLGALWLTYCWYTYNYSPLGSSSGSNFFAGPFSNSIFVIYYFIFNSILLIFLGIFVLIKYFKIYSILAILLGVSVTMSLFIYDYDSTILQNLFIITTVSGIFFGAQFGGIILVPMFLLSTYLNLVYGIKYIRENLKFLSESLIEESKFNITEIIPRKKLSKIIPIFSLTIGILFLSANIFIPVSYFGWYYIVFVSLFLITPSIFSILWKNKSVYKVLNIIILFILTLLVLNSVVYLKKVSVQEDTMTISINRYMPEYEYKLLELKQALENQNSVRSLDYIPSSGEDRPVFKVRLSDRTKETEIVNFIKDNYPGYLNSWGFGY